MGSGLLNHMFPTVMRLIVVDVVGHLAARLVITQFWAGAVTVQDKRKRRMHRNQISKTATTRLTSNNTIFIPPC